MRKFRRILTSFLAIALVLSNLSLSTLTVNATEATDEPIVQEQNDDTSVSQNEPVQEKKDELVGESVSDNNLLMLTNLEGGDFNVDPQNVSGEENNESNEEIITFNQLGSPFGWGYGDAIIVDETTGAATITFNNGGGHGEARFNLPTDFDTSHVTKAELVLEDGSEGVFIKLFLLENAGGYEEDKYGISDYMSEYGNPSVVPTYQFKSIGICSPADENTVTIRGIKFTYGDVTLAEKEAPAEETKGPVVSETGFCKMSDMKLENGGDITVGETTEDGSVTLTFNGQYQSMFVKIPEELKGLAIDKITFNVTSGNEELFIYKAFTTDEYSNKYGDGTDSSTGKATIITAAATKAELTYLAITSAQTADAEGNMPSVTMTISGITFETSEAVEDNTPIMDITYNFVDLQESLGGYQYSHKISAGGEIALDFSQQFAEMKVALPEELDASKITKVKVNLTSGDEGVMAIKQLDSAGEQVKVAYGTLEIVPAGDFSSIGIMAKEGACSIKLSGITFSYKGVAEINRTYTFNDLTECKNGGASKRVDSATGALTLGFSSNFQEIFFAIPKEIDGNRVHKVTFNTTSANLGKTAYKFYTKEGFAGGEDLWPDTSMASYGNTVVEETANNGIVFDDAIYFGIMSCDNSETDWSQHSFVYDSVTFHTTGWGYSEPSEDSDDSEGGVKIFTADDITVSWADPKGGENGEGVYEKVEGKWKVYFTEKQYAQVAFNLPESINLANCTEVKFTIADQTVPIALKLLSNGSEVEAETKYGQSNSTEYVFAPSTTEIINGVGIMYGDGDPKEGDMASLVSIAFTMSGSSDVMYGDNIIKNPNFADATEEGLAVWNSAQGVSVISSEAAAEEIFGDVKTYGKIARDENSSTQDCFMQEITDLVEPGAEYQYEFYAMLSDDYKTFDGYEGSISDLCKVTFGPYGYRSDRINDYGGNEYWGSYSTGILSGDVEKTLTPGEWTKFKGSFTIPKGEEKVFIRIIEQGTNYGNGVCVKGDYYITGVSMKKVIKPETVVEENGLKWKDAITKAFGNDAIAGTCLGSNTISIEYLQELAKQHFNAITFENELKPEAVIKLDNGNVTYNFSTADSMLAEIKKWNDENAEDDIDFKVRGHVLVWHSQTPEWFFHENYDTNAPYVDKDTMNKRMEDYIAAVFNHYKNSDYVNMFYGWDVVNEAMSDQTGKPRKTSDNSNWARIYGDESNEYIINAFRYANKYAPEHIELYYNDYNDCNEPKASGIAQLVKDIKAAEGTRIDGVGMQAHHNFADPSVAQIKSAINKYLDALGEGGTIQMTEFDVKRSTTLDSADKIKAEHDKQAWRFKEIFDAYRDIEEAREGSVGGITMWGITDETSWLQNNNSVGGASSGGTQAPLLFYVDNYVAKAKPAFYAFFDDKVDDLAPMIQSVTVMQQMKADNFDIGRSYDVAGVAKFVPMWTNEGLTIKISVTDNTDNGANDKVTVYIDEANSKSEGNYAKVTVARNAAGVTSTASGYETIVTIPMVTGSAKRLGIDVAVDNNGTVSVFNDKKGGQDSSSEYYAEAIMKPYAEINKGTVSIDGNADAAWANVDVIPLSIVLGAEVTATAKALWDAENLYVYVEVKDANLDATASADHEKDSVEVFIDENNAKAETYEDDDKQYRVNIENEQTFKGTKCMAENIKSAVVKTSDGYVLEAAYKWTDITPSNGKQIGIEFQINDAKGGARIGTASWYDDSGQGYQNPSVLGTALLVDNTSTPSTPDTPSEGGNTKPEGGSSSDSGSSSGGSASDSGSSSSNNDTTKEEVTTPTTPTTPEETPDIPEIVIPGLGGDAEDDEQAEDITPTIPSAETIIPEAVETVVEQLQTLVDADATFEEKVEAVQEVIDTVVEVITNEEVQELAKEAINSIEEKIKEALGIETKVDCKGEDVPEVKSVIGALLSVDAGKQPTLSVEALGKDVAPEMEELDEGFVNGFPLDIKLLADDKEVQPNVPVTIRMGIPKGIDKDKEIKVVHFGKHGKNMLDVALFGEEMEFTTDGFSTFVVVNVESATAGTELVPADGATEDAEIADASTDSIIEEKAEDNGFTTFIIIVIVVAVLALAAVGFFVAKNKKEE